MQGRSQKSQIPAASRRCLPDDLEGLKDSVPNREVADKQKGLYFETSNQLTGSCMFHRFRINTSNIGPSRM